MSEPRQSHGSLRARLESLLRSDDFEARLGELDRLSARQVINPLLSFLYSVEAPVKWHAVQAVARVVARMADEEMEAARTIMRRLIWSLNDESGGIGWGAPEAMGEILAQHARLADEYYRILLSYVRPDGNDLENDLLERGALWGVGRLAQVRPQLLREAPEHLLGYLHSPDAVQRGFAAWALGSLGSAAHREPLGALLGDEATFELFEAGGLRQWRVGEMAARALEQIG